MEKQHFEEMLSAIDRLEKEECLGEKQIYLFGHCNATEELADLFLSRGYAPKAILDNNKNKHGNSYKNIPIVPPEEILMEDKRCKDEKAGGAGHGKACGIVWKASGIF